MNTVIRKIGNSEGVIIPKEILDKLGVSAGDSLSIVAEGNSIKFVPAKNDLARQLEAAREGMVKYKVALRELAK
jgi:putative addiction module antidote